MQVDFNENFVVVFQSENLENGNKYVDALQEESINSKSISTLSFNFINLPKLRSCLENPSNYSGIIFTSPRSVQAVVKALDISPIIEKWKNKFCFSIGKATSEAALSLLCLKTYGSESGNSANLGEIIIDQSKNCDQPLIFPCSNIRRNTIPDILSKHKIQIEEVISYETVPNPQFKKQWEKLIANEGLPRVLVFFSPSGVQHCFKTVMDSYSNNFKPSFVALGPSTEKALMENKVTCKVAVRPNPDDVLHVVKELLNE